MRLARSAFSLSSFQRVVAADVVSTFGSLMSRLAVPWLAVLVLQASPAAMAWITMANVAAGALAALLLGALVDAWPKRRTMVATDLIRAATLVSLPVLAAFDRLTLAWLVAVVAINGAMTVAFELAQSAWIARSTAHDDLTRRNSVLAAGGAATEAASFGLTGWLFQWLGAIAVMLADAATYLVSAVLLLRISEPEPLMHEPRAGALRERLRALAADVRAGLQATAAEPVLRTLAVVATLVEFATSFAATTYMIYVSRDLALPTGILGLLFALGGVGSLAATWITARNAERVPARAWVAGSLLLWALGSAAAPAATAAGLAGVLLIAVQQVVGDAGGMAYGIADRTLASSTRRRRCWRASTPACARWVTRPRCWARWSAACWPSATARGRCCSRRRRCWAWPHWPPCGCRARPARAGQSRPFPEVQDRRPRPSLWRRCRTGASAAAAEPRTAMSQARSP